MSAGNTLTNCQDTIQRRVNEWECFIQHLQPSLDSQWQLERIFSVQVSEEEL